MTRSSLCRSMGQLTSLADSMIVTSAQKLEIEREMVFPWNPSDGLPIKPILWSTIKVTVTHNYVEPVFDRKLMRYPNWQIYKAHMSSKCNHFLARLFLSIQAQRSAQSGSLGAQKANIN